MASENHFSIEIHAAGGHAAMPHLGSDPVLVACNVVSTLQGIITRNLDAIHERCVIGHRHQNQRGRQCDPNGGDTLRRYALFH
ncbi:N-acyl-L-amino acid amidohydrolase [Photobacterium aphoticum]|uniref:N-acyl-L-amino acid amidohydrolase n=1 Tax=Photobacterium aphoticum TaxID=754436 RepID=A0A090QGT2_9GAMM|nr:N-acyl-L-amino acid amidohydrolase [Photobacterium aphoticum]